MTVEIAGVPKTITRADYVRLIESVGLKTDDVVSLEFQHSAIVAVVYALDENGKRYISPRNEAAKHHVSIKVVD